MKKEIKGRTFFYLLVGMVCAYYLLPHFPSWYADLGEKGKMLTILGLFFVAACFTFIPFAADSYYLPVWGEEFMLKGDLIKMFRFSPIHFVYFLINKTVFTLMRKVLNWCDKFLTIKY